MIGIKIITKLLKKELFTNLNVDSENTIKKNPKRKTINLYFE